MNHDDYYNYDPYWNDLEPDECPTCWKTTKDCFCDEDPDDYL